MAVHNEDKVVKPIGKKISIHNLLFDNDSKYKEVGNDYRNLLKLYYEKQLYPNNTTEKALKDFIDTLIYKSITASKDVKDMYQLFIMSGDGWLNTNIDGENLENLVNQLTNDFDNNVLKLVDAYIENARQEGAVINQDLIWLSGKEVVNPEEMGVVVSAAIEKHNELHSEQNSESFNPVVSTKLNIELKDSVKAIETRPSKTDVGAEKSVNKIKNKMKSEKKEMKANPVKIIEGKVYVSRVVDGENVLVDSGVSASGKELTQIYAELATAGLISLPKDKKKRKIKRKIKK